MTWTRPSKHLHRHLGLPGSFMAVKNAFCRLVDEDRGEVARWELSGMFEETRSWSANCIGTRAGGRSS